MSHLTARKCLHALDRWACGIRFGRLRAMNEIDQLSEFLQKLTPLSRSCLLSELERLELCGIDMPGSTSVQTKLRAEFRKDGSTQARPTNPPPHSFRPPGLLLLDG